MAGEGMLNELADKCHKIAVEHGWWDCDRDFGTLAALLHSEVTEMFEAYRHSLPLPPPHMPDEVANIPGVAEEMADILIRLLDMVSYYQVDIGLAVANKMEKNQSRPYRHGGLRA